MAKPTPNLPLARTYPSVVQAAPGSWAATMGVMASVAAKVGKKARSVLLAPRRHAKAFAAQGSQKVGSRFHGRLLPRTK